MADDNESDEEGSLKDFIDDDDDSAKSTPNSSDESSSDKSIKSEKNLKSRVNRSNRTTRSSNRIKEQLLDSSEEENKMDGPENTIETDNKGAWWSGMIEQEHLDDIKHSGKLSLLFAILKECEAIEDKVLVFSQSLFSLDLIEYFLDKIDASLQEDKLEERLGNHQGNWSKGLDYFRLDGSTSSENRNIWCNAFNREDNPRARLFLISTRAGGLGINLTAANRVIIFDASWNPSHDVQSIFRVYRFGQKKPCYVYRFIAYGTMEEKVYERQVAKQSMSNRVVDEQQVHRHFSSNDLVELYSFTPPSKIEDRPIPALPKDVLLAEILTQFKEWIEKYHEHDSLLENVEAEELNEEERKLAWEDFENDKKRSLMPNTGTVNSAMNVQIEILRTNLRAQYPDKSDAELQPMLVSQLAVLLRSQQQRQLQEQQQRMLAAQAQARANTGNLLNPQMFSSANLTPEQMFNLQVLQMQQQQQYANMAARAKLQMTQSHQRVPQSVLVNQPRPSLPMQSQLSQLLSSQLNNAGRNVQMPKMNINPSTAIDMENMRQKYLTSRQKPSNVSITEIPDDPKPSTS